MNNYNASSIKIYKNLEAVRKRPGMYIGNTEDGSGLHKMVFEILDNCVDEFFSGYCNKILVSMLKDGSVSIIDNGRGIPIDIHDETKKSALEVIMTILHSGAKFDDEIYKISGGLHGVGISVVNALSKIMKLKIFRSGFLYNQIYNYGKPVCNLRLFGYSFKRGSDINFIFDDGIFKNLNFKLNIILFRIKEIVYLTKNLLISFLNLNNYSNTLNYCFKNSNIVDFIKDISINFKLISDNIFYFSGKYFNINVFISFLWTDSQNENIFCYTNNIRQKDYGSHYLGFKNSLVKSFKKYIESNYSKNNVFIHYDDIKEGLFAIISIYMNNPEFSSQNKDKLISLECKYAIEKILSFKFIKFLSENSVEAKNIISRIVLNSKARNASLKMKEFIKQKKNISDVSFLSKFSPCEEKNPIFSEIFLVEGDSAGGSAKQARDRRFQAILPLKGKILNVERVDLKRIIFNNEIRSILSALNCNTDFNSNKKLRYHKIIFMTDADVDGSHIRTLLITFFYRYMPWIIENGYLFISKPPLYRFQINDSYFYIQNKFDFNTFLIKELSTEILKFLNINDFFLNKILNLYLKFESMLEKISLNFSKNFIIGLVFFKDLNYLKKKKLNKFINSFKNFLNIEKNLDFDLYIKKDSLNELFILEKNYGKTKTYDFNLNLLNSNEFKFFFKFNNLLCVFFKKIEKLKFNDEFFNLGNFDKFILKLKNKILSNYVIQRYKGLGEMNADQLWYTTMNPETRNLFQLKIKNHDNANKIFSNLMGENSTERKKIIEQHSKNIIDLDI